MRSGTLRMVKWPGEVSMLRGMSPGGPPPSTFLTEATSNLRVCAHEAQIASVNRLAAILMWFTVHLLPQRRTIHGVDFPDLPEKQRGASLIVQACAGGGE